MVYVSSKMRRLVCPICDTRFETKSRTKKYCSPKCAKVVYDKYQAERREKLKKNRPKEREVVCPVCGNTFSTRHRLQIYCNKGCWRVQQERNRIAKKEARA